MRKIIVDDQEWKWSVKNNKLGVYCSETKVYAQRRLDNKEIEGEGRILYEAITPKKVREFILGIDEMEELKV